jgi:hypothetical protein
LLCICLLCCLLSDVIHSRAPRRCCSPAAVMLESLRIICGHLLFVDCACLLLLHTRFRSWIPFSYPLEQTTHFVAHPTHAARHSVTAHNSQCVTMCVITLLTCAARHLWAPCGHNRPSNKRGLHVCLVASVGMPCAVFLHSTLLRDNCILRIWICICFVCGVCCRLPLLLAFGL